MGLQADEPHSLLVALALNMFLDDNLSKLDVNRAAVAKQMFSSDIEAEVGSKTA